MRIVLATIAVILSLLGGVHANLPGVGGMFPTSDCPQGGNLNFGSIREAAICMSGQWADNPSPLAGGSLTINGNSMGTYGYRVVTGNQTISAFNSSDWFTATDDSQSAWVLINGNLTVNAGQTFRPNNRKLFTVVYVTGDCTINGSISMTARGANHGTSGSNIPAVAIRIATGTFSAVVNPEVPAVGGAAVGGVTGNGGTGGAGSNGGTGGGGGGGANSAGSAGVGGASSAGTSFSGGSGGGAASSGFGSAATSNGGQGGQGFTAGNPIGASSGNPGGGINNPIPQGNSGTGGTLMVFCLGTYTGSGSIQAAGVAGTGCIGGACTTGSAGGSGSGGGSATIMCGVCSGPTPTAVGGGGGSGSPGANGGTGGNGTGRSLVL